MGAVGLRKRSAVVSAFPRSGFITAATALSQRTLRVEVGTPRCARRALAVLAVMNPLPIPRTATGRFRNPFNTPVRFRTLLPDRVAGWHRLSG